MDRLTKRIRDSAVLYSIVISIISIFELCLYYMSIPFVPIVKILIKHRMKSVGGIEINPENKYAKAGDMMIYSDKYYMWITGYRTLGMGQAYMEGVWESNDLEELFYKIFINDLQYDIETFPRFYRFLDHLKFGFFNLQTPSKSWLVGQIHYDLGNELYEKMLDKTMTYTCAYWKNAKNLEEAQLNKLELVAQKLKLQPGMKVLDFGCGWGGLCKYLAQNHKVQMVGCTVGVEGAKYGQDRCVGLPVDIRACDYRDINEKFDRIVSVGMFEHVGTRNYRSFFEQASHCLKDDGILLMHFIGVDTKKMPSVDGWVNTYIFPGGSLPYPMEILRAIDGLFVIEDWQNMGYHYHKTLNAWLANFNRAWPSLKKNYEEPEKFYRMWTYYLILSSALFRSRRLQLWQLVLTKQGLAGGYDSPR